ncbi:MAG TPA: amidohydrolase, partial [Burkholderiales bacterium]|nr:amidohydrolase [Burkholderiales bacterium]
MRGELEAIRRELHAHPELGFEEARTAALVQEKLAAWGIEVHAGIATTGVVGVLRGRGGSSARAVGLRADMDCLPIEETSGVPWRSRRPGLMHACGHDGHTAMLLGAARYLAQTRAFDGTVVLIFQPAEEGRGGGARMVAEGLFERFPVDAVYALHNWPLLPPGTIAVRPGPMMAAVDELEIVVHGTGGHAAMPHLAVDAVVAGAQIISALQTVASRSVSPVEAVVVSVCSVQTSQVGAFNVLPDSVRLLGTVRSFRPETRALAHERVRAIAGQVAAALGARAEVNFRRGNPATVNTP